MKTKIKYSCEDLQSSIYFAPNMLRHCCQRFFVKGKMKGDVEILKVKNDNDINIENIIKEKKEIIKKLNNNLTSPCDGCPKIKKQIWPNEIKIKKISIEAHSKCNLRCSYCSDMFYGGLDPSYDIEKMFEKFKKKNFFSKDVSITWGGGEAVLLKNFNKIFEKFIESRYPNFNDVRVYSNSVIYNELVHKYLDKNKIILTTSIDSGTQKTFELVRGVKKGFLNIFKNLRKYNSKKSGNIIIKYIVTDDNYTENEVDSFVSLIKKYDLLNCNFEISTDYKGEELSLKKALSLVYFFNKLHQTGATFVHFDDHVRKRLYKILHQKLSMADLEKNNIFDNIKKYFNTKIIVWGTGRYADELISNSFLFKKAKIDFFVDKHNKDKKKFLSKDVMSPQQLINSTNPILIASSTYWHEIYENILKLGVNKSRIINTLII
jgi:poly(ribitol-phosphate) beta-N-acetylglucosaminyltransferase